MSYDDWLWRYRRFVQGAGLLFFIHLATHESLWLRYGLASLVMAWLVLFILAEFLIFPYIDAEKARLRAKEEAELAARTWPSPATFANELIELSVKHVATFDRAFINPTIVTLTNFYEKEFAKRKVTDTTEDDYDRILSLAHLAVVRMSDYWATIEKGRPDDPLRAPAAKVVGADRVADIIRKSTDEYLKNPLTAPVLDTVYYQSADSTWDEKQYKWVVTRADSERYLRQMKDLFGREWLTLELSFWHTPLFGGRTDILKSFNREMSLPVPTDTRFSHTHIIAGTGHGKTQTLQRFITRDMESEAGLVVIDSQGEMLKKIARLKTDKRIIYIDPTDVKYPPALNMFDVSRLKGLPQAKREQFTNGLIELLEYVFAGLLKAELTQKQNVLFRYSLRLMLAVPGATLLDLVRFLSNPQPYLQHAQNLSITVQEFFQNELLGEKNPYAQTREQIRRRLYGVLENDSFRRMFSSKHNRLDVAIELSRGSVILVDTSKAFLKADASSLLGRYFIALTLQAALEREGTQNPAFLYIDEAGEYFDDNIDTLLNEARKRRVGLVMAHQYLGQLTPQLRSSIATNTAIKLAGGISDADARTLAADMRVDPETLHIPQKGTFACYVKGVTEHAIPVKIPFGTLENAPQKSPEEWDQFLTDNRALLYEPAGTTEKVRPRVAPASEPKTSEEDDILPSKDW